MSLTLKSKTPVRFEWTDDEAETVVALLPDDDQETLVRKLRRIIALTEPEAPELPAGQSKLVPRWAPPAKERWGSPEPPEIPDHLKGVIELEDAPAEPVIGNGWGEGPPSA